MFAAIYRIDGKNGDQSGGLCEIEAEDAACEALTIRLVSAMTPL